MCFNGHIGFRVDDFLWARVVVSLAVSPGTFITLCLRFGREISISNTDLPPAKPPRGQTPKSHTGNATNEKNKNEENDPKKNYPEFFDIPIDISIGCSLEFDLFRPTRKRTKRNIHLNAQGPSILPSAIAVTTDK